MNQRWPQVCRIDTPFYICQIIRLFHKNECDEMHFEILVTINVFSNDTPPCITLIDFHCLCIADIHSILLFYFLVL